PLRRSRVVAAMPFLLLASLVPGCARSRTFTIYSKPADAKLLINGVDRGPGPVTQRFLFSGSGDSVPVTAVREGYESKTQRLGPDTSRDTVVIELEPLGPRAIVSVEPAAMVRVDGVPVQPRPVRQAEVVLDRSTPDRTYTLTAEQPGYAREVRTISAHDPAGYYRIVLRPLRQELAVALAPSQAPQQAPERPATRE